MPEPQPGADRPADGGTPDRDRDRDPAVSDQPLPPSAAPSTGPAGTPTPPTDVPAGTGDDTLPAAGDRITTDDASVPGDRSATTGATSAGSAGDHPAPPDEDRTDDDRTASARGVDEPANGDRTADDRADDGTADDRAGDGDAAPAAGDGAATTDEGGTTPAGPAAATEPTPPPVTPARGSATVPTRAEPAPAETRPDPTRVETRPDPSQAEARPDPTRVETRPEPAAPRWSGSAAVPPPPPRKRGWGESAEPTPLPPPAPEHQVPVDPWAGADTSGWELHSADFPALPPTLPYPAPPAAPPPVVPAPVAARPVSPPPAPASPPPPAPARPPKQRRRSAPPPAAPPPDWRAPKGYVPVPVRRRRRWPWLLLLTVACCCGVPLWWAQPLSAQYPAAATLPDQVAGLRLREDERSQATAERLKTEVRQAHLLAEDTFAGVYATNDGKRVTVFGGTGFRLSPESDAKAEIARLTERYALDPAVPVETGVRGRYERCAVGRADGDAVVVCTSVDHGSLATGVFTRLSVDDSGALLDTLRQQIITPEQS